MLSALKIGRKFFQVCVLITLSSVLEVTGNGILNSSKRDDVLRDFIVHILFGLVNDMLHRQGSSLRLRRYSVGSIGFHVGVIEFIENTTTLFDAIVGKNESSGRHATMHPMEETKGPSEKKFQ